MRDRKIASPLKTASQQIPPRLGLDRGQSSWGSSPSTTFTYLFIFNLSLTSILKNIKCYSMQLAYGYGTTANSKLRA